MLTLFHAPQSRSSRIIWLLEELGSEAEVACCDIRRMDGSGARDPANPHPDGKVPALIHDGALITESAAVALYLNDFHPDSPVAVPVGDRDRAGLVTWLAWVAGEWEPVLGGLWGGPPEGEAAQRRHDDAVDRLLEALWSAPYLLGERFSAADVMLGSGLSWARHLLPESPTLDAYVARLEARPARLRALARDGEIALTRAA